MAEKPTSVVLTAELERRLREEATRETISVSAVVRKALRSYFLASDVTQTNRTFSERNGIAGDREPVGVLG